MNLFQYHKPLQHKKLSAKMGRNLSELRRFNNPRTKYDRKMYEAENVTHSKNVQPTLSELLFIATLFLR